MKEKTSNAYLNQRKSENREDIDPDGYPLYPETEDIYGKCHKERWINPEDPARAKEPFEILKTGINNEKDFMEDVSGSDLDIPGSELDDDLEFIGSEDEENNYYSLGGDNHNDLGEDYVE
jgi:hypothetical protein